MRTSTSPLSVATIIASMLTILIIGCASTINPIDPTTIKYTPGETLSDDLVKQAGLPNLVDSVVIEGISYKKFIYLKGPEFVRSYIPIAIPVSGYVTGGVLIKDFQARPESVLECLVSRHGKVLDCKGGIQK